MKLFAFFFLYSGSLACQELIWENLPALAQKAPAFQAAEARFESARAFRGALRRSLHPKLGAFAGLGGVTDGSQSEAGVEGGLKLQWNLWRGGLDQAEGSWRDAAGSEAEAEAQYSQARLLAETREAWIEAWDFQGRAQAIKRALQRSQEDIKAARQKAAAGLTPLSEVDEQELRASQLDHHAHLDEQARDLALARLAGLLGLETASLPESIELGWPPAGPMPSGPGPVESRAQARLKLAKAAIDRAPSWPQPSLDLDGEWIKEKRRLPLEAPALRGGIRLSAELWDGGVASARQSVLGLDLQSAQLEVQAAAALESAMRKAAHNDVRRWLEHKPHLEERIALAAKIRGKVIDEYRRGVRDGRDLSGSSAELLEVEEEWAEDRAIAWKSWTKLQATGTKSP